MSEQRVRDLLEEVARPVPPPDLAEQAWQRAGRVRRRRFAVAAATTAVAAVVAGVAYLLPPSPNDVTPTTQALRGRQFTSTSAPEPDLPPSSRMQTARASLEFTSDDRYVARTGCFIMSGHVRADGGRLDLSRRESRFSSACDNVRVAHNQLFIKLMETDPLYRLNGDTLTLTSGDIEIVLRSLPGRTFMSTGVEEAGKPSDLLGSARVRLAFTTDGGLRADVGCNQLSGTADLRDWRIKARLTTTDMACDQVRAQETWLGEFLATNPNWSLDGSTLVLTGGSYQLRLVEGG